MFFPVGSEWLYKNRETFTVLGHTADGRLIVAWEDGCMSSLTPEPGTLEPVKED